MEMDTPSASEISFFISCSTVRRALRKQQRPLSEIKYTPSRGAATRALTSSPFFSSQSGVHANHDRFPPTSFTDSLSSLSQAACELERNTGNESMSILYEGSVAAFVSGSCVVSCAAFSFSPPSSFFSSSFFSSSSSEGRSSKSSSSNTVREIFTSSSCSGVPAASAAAAAASAASAMLTASSAPSFLFSSSSTSDQTALAIPLGSTTS